jgi:hypothetical protein
VLARGCGSARNAESALAASWTVDVARAARSASSARSVLVSYVIDCVRRRAHARRASGCLGCWCRTVERPGTARAGLADIPEDVTSRMVSPVFVGRETELAVLASAVRPPGPRDTGHRAGRSGAGGGKSRCVAEFSPTWEPALVLAGGCVELSEASLPYGPFTAALGNWPAGGVRLGHALRAAVAGPGTAELSAALRPAAAANVVVAGTEQCAFRHELIRKARRRKTCLQARAQVHRAFAEALEDTPVAQR